jgi:hypothetical protein
VQLAAIILARTLGYIETFDLSPRGKVFFPDMVHGIVERYNFQKFPTKVEDFDESKGVVFEEGRIGNKVIQKFTIYTSLLVVETRSSTSDSKEILEEMLLWGAAKFGISYSPGAVKRYAYVSGVSFYSEVPILTVSSVLDNLAAKTSKALSDIWQEPIQYETTGLAIGHDPMARKYAIAQFTLTRRQEARFVENKYYSEAPLPTEMHLAFLEEFESGVRCIKQGATK